MAIKTSAAARRLQQNINKSLAPKLATETAVVVGRNLISINGQVYTSPIEAEIGQSVAVVNRGTPSRAVYLPANGDGAVTVSNGGGGTISVNIEAHALSDLSVHRGELARSQASWAFPVDGSRTIVGHVSLAAGVTVDGMDPSAHIANPAAHHDPATAGPGITVQGQMISIQPGTISAQTFNNAQPAGQHTHFALATSDGNAERNYLLKSNPTGGLTLDYLQANVIRSTGDIVLDPSGDDVLPRGHIDVDLGDINRKWRTLFAAELFVETLVAQHVMATIGGRIVVAPTTKLAEPINGSYALQMYVEHNLFLAGDYGFMQTANGGLAQIEAVRILDNGAKTTAGTYRYSIARNQDGTTGNSWKEGDAIINLGGAPGRGSGFIELTSTQTIHQHLGPTITIYSRPRTGVQKWNSSVPVWSAGNLESFLDYSEYTIGQAFGNNLLLRPSEGQFRGITNDNVVGTRMFNTSSEYYRNGEKVLSISQEAGVDLQRDNTPDGVIQRRIDWWPNLNSKTGQPTGSIRQHADSLYNNLSLWAHSMDRGGAKIRLLANETVNGQQGTSALIEVSRRSGSSDITVAADNIQLIGRLGSWLTLSKASGWIDSGGSTYWPLSVKRMGDIIFLRGIIGRSGGSGGTTPGTIIAYLPGSGYLPARYAWRAVQMFGDSTYAMGRVNIHPDGKITMVDPGGLSNIQFISFDTFWSTATT